MADNTDDRKELGLEIKLARVAKGWSQDTLALHANVSQVSISRLENGSTNPEPLLSSVLKALREGNEEELLT